MKKTTDSFGRQIQIGNVVLENNVFLAPMAGVTDLPFRLICKEQGAGLLCMEMISAKAVHYNNKNTETLMEIHPDELPVSLQLFGSEPEIMAETAAHIEERPFAILDINMGCPVPKVVNNREGSALMKNPRLAGEIIHAVAKAVSKPVTVKIRKGFDDNSVNAVELAKIAEANGAAAVAVHGRTRGCDAVMVGRASRGNPWIFREINAYLDTGELLPRPSKEEVRDTILRHAALLLAYKGEYTAIREMRKHVAWYTAGYPHSARLRQRINEMETVAQLEEGIRTIFS